MSFYAVKNGRTPGIFTSWNECKDSIHGYKGALYKKFITREEAEKFIHESENNNEFKIDYYVYTDGSSSKRGVGIGVFFGIDDPRNISEMLSPNNTNQTAELIAILRVLQMRLTENIMIVSDSEYAIRCISGYYKTSHTDIVNEAKQLFTPNTNIQFMHVKAHTGKSDLHSIGNFHADRLATSATTT